MSMNINAVNNNRDWNSKKLIELSDNLGKAYNPGLDNAKSDYSAGRLRDRQADFWTVDKFITMSRHLSSAYGVYL